MTNPYQRYAEIYDRTGQDRFGATLAQVSLERLATFEARIGTAIDLATGTGAAAIELALTGIDVTAFDQSREMLREARRKSVSLPQPIVWRVGSMEHFTADRPVDLVTCFFDSINYLLEADDLSACFDSVASALVPDGWFVFDANTIGRFEADWNRTTHVAYENDDLLCLFRSTYDPETHLSPLQLTVFERDSTTPSIWRRWDEEHVERGYHLAELTSLLENAGFEILAIDA
ncbi:MAG: class I SAM-dependent DNA methyltransferase, partial [Thermomicrobiales bacterium]